jgi:hypothetical protein
MNRWYFNSKKCYSQYITLIESSDLTSFNKELIKTNWLKYFIYLDQLAIKDSIFFHSFQIIIITSGLAIPFIELNNTDINNSFFTTSSFLGLLIAFCAAIDKHFKFENRWKHYRQNAERIRIEGENYLGLANNYSSYNNLNDAFAFFVQNISKFKESENNIYIKKIRKK